MLAVTRCEQQGVAFSADVLTPQALAELVRCLAFGKFGPGGSFDIKIEGYGLSMLVSAVANTVLKEPTVSKNIPTVARLTQGSHNGLPTRAPSSNGLHLMPICKGPRVRIASWQAR